MVDALIVFVTVSSQEEADRLAEAVVSERLAACVNIVPGIESVYRWRGNLARDKEFLLLIKSARGCYDRLEQRIKELHSYETPEIIAITIEEGSPQYLDWLANAVRLPSP